MDDLKFAKQLLLESDVVTIPGSGFGAAGKGYLRIAYTAPVDILEEAFSRLNVFYKNFRQN
jgi:aspartate/methionine/tyrosine aminotransferase